MCTIILLWETLPTLGSRTAKEQEQGDFVQPEVIPEKKLVKQKLVVVYIAYYMYNFMYLYIVTWTV